MAVGPVSAAAALCVVGGAQDFAPTAVRLILMTILVLVVLGVQHP
ncbi:hypothetical protein AB0J57_11925 [Streptomyces sp. NPDC049837]